MRLKITKRVVEVTLSRTEVTRLQLKLDNPKSSKKLLSFQQGVILTLSVEEDDIHNDGGVMDNVFPFEYKGNKRVH